MQKKNDAIRTSGHSSLEKYTSHFIWKGSKGLLKVLLCEKGVGDWTELQHIDPHSYGHNSVSFPFSWAAQPGAWGASLSGTMVLIPASSLQLIWTPTAQLGVPRAPLLAAGCWLSLPHLISNWLELPVHRVISLFYVHSIQHVHRQGYPLDTFDRTHLLSTQVHFPLWQLDRGQYATNLPKPNPCCIAWSKQKEALVSTWTQIRQSSCVLNKMESSPRQVASLWNLSTTSHTSAAISHLLNMISTHA